MRILLLLLTLAGPAPAFPAPAFPALANPGESLTLWGAARTGSDTRAVRFVFLCSASEGPNVTGVLGVDLAVPQHDTLRTTFDFDPFEGPDAQGGRLTRVEASAEGAFGQGRFIVSGSIGAEADGPFVFGLSAARRRDAARLAELTRVLAPLTNGPARFTWEQGQLRASGSPILARLEISAADSTRLRVLLRPCLGG